MKTNRFKNQLAMANGETLQFKILIGDTLIPMDTYCFTNFSDETKTSEIVFKIVSGEHVKNS